MDIAFSSQSPEDLSCDLLAVVTGADLEKSLAALDRRFEGHLLQALRDEAFDGKPGSSQLVPTLGRLGARRLLVLGVGDGSPDTLRDAAGMAGRAARKAGARSVALSLGGLDAATLARAVEAFHAGNYAYDRHKKETDRKAAAETLTLLGASRREGEALEAAQRVAARQAWARDLVNGPAHEVYPGALAEAARGLAGNALTVEVWDAERCAKEGLVGIEAVGRGSDRPGCMIHLRYRPKGARAHVAFVGKGVTFDSGGLSLKPSGGMQTMRCDMGGAAAVLAATAAASDLGLPVAIDCFVGAVENMVSGSSYKLGDILTYRNGVTVEIHNTDAEGRLVLADCLCLASEVPEATTIVDAATLTGACVVALGSDYTGVFTEDDGLAEALVAAGRATGEHLWRLPLHAGYKKNLKADWAQIKNVGGREGGAITAALFLQHFVAEGRRWAHLDIAGPSFYEKDERHYAAGATGEPVRTLVRWLETL